MIGAIGSNSLDDVIIFEVSDDKILTVNDFVRKNSVRFSKNDVLLKKPVSQYIGSQLDTITFKIIFRAQYGVSPQFEMNKLIYLQRDGAVVSVLIGKTVFGIYRWRIVDLNMAWRDIDSSGFLISSACDISLEEYV